MADKLNINLKYCYGIGKLEAELEFKHKGYAIYAPNGVMKTSFAKTMMDLSAGNTPKDLHFPDREPTCEITLNGEGLKKEEVFVVKSYDDKFSSSQVSTLLANAELRTKYERIHQSIGEAKKALDKALRNAAGFGERSRENLDSIIEDVFSGSYYEALSAIEDELTRTSQSDLSKADYKIIYDPKVQQFLSSEDVAAAVEDFAQKYDEITEQSPILRRNFQYHNVAQVQQQLEANNFFSAGHRISLADEKTDQMEEVSSDQSLRQRIEDEKLRVLNDEAVAKKFDTFNSKLKNKELQTFRDYITENKQLLPMLSDPEGLKRDLWMQYLRVAFDEYKTLVSEYRTGQSALAEIVKEADESRGDWDAVVADFNRRFLYLPFELSVENKADAILKGIAPSIAFVVKDAGEERRYASSEKQDLLRALSTGESRALYILDIMYAGITRKAPSKRPLMRRKPIWSARPSLWESPRRALIASRSAPSKVKNAFISKSLISRGSPRIPKNDLYNQGVISAEVMRELRANIDNQINQPEKALDLTTTPALEITSGKLGHPQNTSPGPAQDSEELL